MQPAIADAALWARDEDTVGVPRHLSGRDDQESLAARFENEVLVKTGQRIVQLLTASEVEAHEVHRAQLAALLIELEAEIVARQLEDEYAIRVAEDVHRAWLGLELAKDPHDNGVGIGQHELVKDVERAAHVEPSMLDMVIGHTVADPTRVVGRRVAHHHELNITLVEGLGAEDDSRNLPAVPVAVHLLQAEGELLPPRLDLARRAVK